MKLLAIVSLLISGTASYALAKPATHEVAAAYDANDIGKYIVGDTVLHVPKDYVFVTKNLEGKREVLSLNFYYPTLLPVMDYDLHYDAINVALSPCITDCSSSIERRFNSRANQQMLVNKEQGIYKARFKTSAEEYIKKLGLWRKNLIPVSGSDDYRGALYYKKPLNAKGYWFICDESVANPGCKSVFELSPSSHATLYFNIRQLKNHKDIREKITALVQSFVKKD